jgi:YD repeat-containing protein
MIGSSGGVRGWLVAGLAGLALDVGCERSQTLPCRQSIAERCALVDSCVPSWEEASIGTAVCALPAYALLRADCGGYHVLAVHAVDGSGSYYYDAANGRLVAIVDANGSTGTTTCIAGPVGGFTLPTCTGSISEPLPQCLDGGADAVAGRDGATD